MMTNHTRKDSQRKRGLAARKAIDSKTAQQFSRTIADALSNEPAFLKADVVLSYQAFAGEVDTSFINEIAATQGKTLAFPICYEAGIMVAAVPKGPESWESGKFGIRAPIENQSVILDPAVIDLVIVPCTAFDGATRMRIGWGAGYYDRFLLKCTRAVTIAVAYDTQEVEGLHYDSWDVPLDAVITEKKRY